MNELEILKEKIELLQKIIDTQTQLIGEIRKTVPLQVVSIPSVWQVPCQHEFPFPWYGVTPPPCKKCGQLGMGYTITSTASSDIIVK